MKNVYLTIEYSLLKYDFIYMKEQEKFLVKVGTMDKVQLAKEKINTEKRERDASFFLC